MRALILDMYGVIMKDPEAGFIPFVNSTFPDLRLDDIYLYWDKADAGEISSLDFLREIGIKGDLGKTEKEFLDTVEINESFYEFAPILKQQFHLALLSNDISEWSRYIRSKYKLNEYFDVITVSGDVKVRKPDPEIFLLTVGKLGLPASHCIYVDDRRSNLSAAQALGMDTILFNTRNVPYDGKTVNSFKELAEMLIHTY